MPSTRRDVRISSTALSNGSRRDVRIGCSPEPLAALFSRLSLSPHQIGLVLLAEQFDKITGLGVHGFALAWSKPLIMVERAVRKRAVRKRAVRREPLSPGASRSSWPVAS